MHKHNHLPIFDIGCFDDLCGVIFAIMADEPIVAFTICPEKRDPHRDYNDPVFQIACFHPGTLRLAAGASSCDDAGLEHIISHHRTLYIDNMAAHVEERKSVV